MRNVIIALALLTLAAPLPAQRDRAAEAKAADSAAIASPQRTQLERRLRQRVLDVVRDRLDLSQDQVQKLSATTERYDAQRRTLAQRERSLRLELRAQLRRGDSAEQKTVADLLEKTLRAQQDRLNLYRQEQSDLAAFLTPVQRAKYMGLQEQMRSRVEELRRSRSDRSRRPRPGSARPARATPDTSGHSR